MDHPPPLPQPVHRSTSRVGWLDIFRGIAIILVVFGHTARGLDHAKILPDYEGSFLDDWIYAFHMPAFFFAAGLFANRSLDRGAGRFVRDKLRTIAWPYLVWSVLFLLSLMLMPGSANTPYHHSDWLRIFYSPVGNYWFLFALFFIQMMYLIAADPNWGRRIFWWGSVVLWAVEPFKPFDLLLGPAAGAMHQVMKYAIYFAYGDWVAWRTADSYTPSRNCRLFALIEFGLMTLLVAMGRSHEDRWWALPLAIAGIQGLWELSVALDQSGEYPWLQFLGQRSLEIYVAHNFACVAERIILLKLGVTSWTIHLAMGTLAGIVLPLGLWLVCKKLNFPYLFAWPRKVDSREE